MNTEHTVHQQKPTAPLKTFGNVLRRIPSGTRSSQSMAFLQRAFSRTDLHNIECTETRGVPERFVIGIQSSQREKNCSTFNPRLASQRERILVKAWFQHQIF
ncbi:uncharacterized [Tachysurus ichikawai]